jgi:AcrR family transcriptional regulator
MPKIIDETNIFRTVIDTWVSHGYEGATTKEIADLAGLNETTLFRKYGSKVALFEKAVNHQLEDTPLNRIAYTGDLEADLLAIVEAYMETNELYGEIIPTLLTELPRHPELKGAFDRVWGNMQRILGIIQEYQAQGTLTPESPLTTLNALVGPMMTSQMIRCADLSLPVPDLDPLEHVNTFLHGRTPG